MYKGTKAIETIAEIIITALAWQQEHKIITANVLNRLFKDNFNSPLPENCLDGLD